ncbi:9767_t:CDS:2, partial [Funneliformis mosseae]
MTEPFKNTTLESNDAFKSAEENFSLLQESYPSPEKTVISNITPSRKDTSKRTGFLDEKEVILNQKDT